MIVSAVMLSGTLSREFTPGVSARLTDGAVERAISVGISTALFGWPGLWQIDGGTNLILPCDQMMIATQYLYRVSSPRAVQRFDQMGKKTSSGRAQPEFAFGGSKHR